MAVQQTAVRRDDDQGVVDRRATESAFAFLDPCGDRDTPPLRDGTKRREVVGFEIDRVREQSFVEGRRELELARASVVRRAIDGLHHALQRSDPIE